MSLLHPQASKDTVGNRARPDPWLARVRRFRCWMVAALLLPASVSGQTAASNPASAVRLPDGRPGPGYWQQQVDYSVDARLEPAARRLTGTARVLYHNNSPDALSELHWHLYQNIFREDSDVAGLGAIVGRRMALTRGITVHRIEIAGQPLQLEVRGTLMRTPLGAPLLPRQTLVLDAEWEYEIPAIPSLRTGSSGEDFGMAQWYPQIAAYDDQHGWNETPYRGSGEFYLEYGTWDVRLTVPADYIVAATGTLQNPEQVLTPGQLSRLVSAASEAPGQVTRIVLPSELRGRQGEPAAEERTWHFVARDVRDFAWAASPNFVWDATRTVPLVHGAEGVWMHSFYRPNEERHYHGSAALARRVIEFWSARFGTYLYPQATVVSGPVEGMEYPMLAFGGPSSRIENHPLSVIVHELAHQWYPMMLGTHETRFPAMDEGMTTFITSVALEELFGRYSFWSPRLPAFAKGFLGKGDERRILQALYLMAASGTTGPELADAPLLRHAHLMTEFQIGALVYVKTASVLVMLRDLLGEDVFLNTLQAYYERWRLKHPYPDDFFRTVENVSGRELDWFWAQWFDSTARLDLALRSVEQEEHADGWRARVIVANEGSASMAATIRLTLDDGSTRDLRVPETVWLSGVRTHLLAADDLPARVRSAEIDPQLILADVHRDNNVWPPGISPAAGPLLGMSWGALLILLLTAGLAVQGARVGSTAMAARSAAVRVVRYGWGPLTLWTATRGLCLEWMGWRRLFAGGIISTPPAAANAGAVRSGLTRVLVGGPAAWLATGAVGAGAVLALELAHRAGLRGGSSLLPDAFLATCAAFAVLAFLFALVPSPTRGYLAPSPWLRLLVNRGPRAERWCVTRALFARSWAGERPRQWSAEWIAAATHLSDGSRAEAGACMLAYMWALDNGDPDVASALLKRAEAATCGWWRRPLHRHVLAERRFFQERYEGGIPSTPDAGIWSGARGVPRHVVARATAATALGADAGAAAQIAAAALQRRERISARMGSGIAVLEEEWLREILARAADDCLATDDRVNRAEPHES